MEAHPRASCACGRIKPLCRANGIFSPRHFVAKQQRQLFRVVSHARSPLVFDRPAEAARISDEIASEFCGTEGKILQLHTVYCILFNLGICEPKNTFICFPLSAGQVLTRPSAGTGKKYHIHTFGCQMNLADSERMAGVLESVGYSCANDASDADVLIYNTCSIRDKAEQKVYSALGKQVGKSFGGLQFFRSWLFAAIRDL